MHGRDGSIEVKAEYKWQRTKIQEEDSGSKITKPQGILWKFRYANTGKNV
ncbi:hypothetical protein [Treponema sp.]